MGLLTKFTDGPTVSRFAHITRSALAQRLFENAEDDQLRPLDSGRRTAAIPYPGSADKAHIRLRTFKKTLARHGYRLNYTHHGDALLLWATLDPTVDRVAAISKPRSAHVRKVNQVQDQLRSTGKL